MSKLIGKSSVHATSQYATPDDALNASVPSTGQSSHHIIIGTPNGTFVSSPRVDLASQGPFDEYGSTDGVATTVNQFTSSISSELGMAIPLDMTSSTVRPPSTQSQTINITSTEFQPLFFDSYSQVMSTDATSMDMLFDESMTQIASSLSNARNPAQAASEISNRALIPLPQTQEGYKMFTTGYNQQIFLEVANMMTDEKLDEYFDFDAYARGGLENGNTASMGIDQVSYVNGRISVHDYDAPKQQADLNVDDEFTGGTEDARNQVNAAHGVGTVNSNPCSIDTSMGHDGQGKDASVEFSEIHDPDFGSSQSAAEKAIEIAGAIDGGMEIEGLDEVDQL